MTPEEQDFSDWMAKKLRLQPTLCRATLYGNQVQFFSSEKMDRAEAEKAMREYFDAGPAGAPIPDPWMLA